MKQNMSNFYQVADQYRPGVAFERMFETDFTFLF